jgi:hypothetical protein
MPNRLRPYHSDEEEELIDVDGMSLCCAQPSSASNARSAKYLMPYLRF